jgi:hypothetical protein
MAPQPFNNRRGPRQEDRRDRDDARPGDRRGDPQDSRPQPPPPPRFRGPVEDEDSELDQPTSQPILIVLRGGTLI